MSPSISWSGNEEFYEVAALLGILPSMVMAKVTDPDSPLVTVLYTPAAEADSDDPPVWSAQLWRGADDVLRIEANRPTGRTFSSFVPPEEP